MMRLLPTIAFLVTTLIANAQGYTSYFTGNTVDEITESMGGICLMGGATESDAAMQWFLERANGGDVLVLRASGSDGYNDYFYSELGVSVNSVETIVFTNASASSSEYVHERIQQAEAIWFAGGDQWNYISYWRGTEVAALINEAINTRNIVIGGTSAGMAILGEYYFSAENGTITSDEAIDNPYHPDATVDGTPFLSIGFLEHTITDTHYDNPDRRGRHIAFLARMLTDAAIVPRGIACEEYTAICVDENGWSRVFGEYPEFDDFAYFIQPNCALSDYTPEACNANEPLEWNKNSQALNVYGVPGTIEGLYGFDLSDWLTGIGGTWLHWSISNQNVNQILALPPDCSVGIDEDSALATVFPNPTADVLNIETLEIPELVLCYDLSGNLVMGWSRQQQLDVRSLPAGLYLLSITTATKTAHTHFIKH